MPAKKPSRRKAASKKPKGAPAAEPAKAAEPAPPAPKRGRGRPVTHVAGFSRTSLILPPDLLLRVDRMCLDWRAVSGRFAPRSELLRALLEALLAAHAAGLTRDLATAADEQEMQEALVRRFLK